MTATHSWQHDIHVHSLTQITKIKAHNLYDSAAPSCLSPPLPASNDMTKACHQLQCLPLTWGSQMWTFCDIWPQQVQRIHWNKTGSKIQCLALTQGSQAFMSLQQLPVASKESFKIHTETRLIPKSSAWLLPKAPRRLCPCNSYP
jgi:hypothetical protein